MYKREDQIFVRINRAGFIPHLGMCGPIPNPIKVTCGKCLDMINSGIEVWQVDPETKEMVKLTVKNIFDDQKFSKKTENPVNIVEPAPSIEQPITFGGVKKDSSIVDVDLTGIDLDVKPDEPTNTQETVVEKEKSEEDTDKVDSEKKEDKSEEKSDDKKDDTKSNTNNKNSKKKHK